MPSRRVVSVRRHTINNARVRVPARDEGRASARGAVQATAAGGSPTPDSRQEAGNATSERTGASTSDDVARRTTAPGTAPSTQPATSSTSAAASDTATNTAASGSASGSATPNATTAATAEANATASSVTPTAETSNPVTPLIVQTVRSAEDTRRTAAALAGNRSTADTERGVAEIKTAAEAVKSAALNAANTTQPGSSEAESSSRSNPVTPQVEQTAKLAEERTRAAAALTKRQSADDTEQLVAQIRNAAEALKAIARQRQRASAETQDARSHISGKVRSVHESAKGQAKAASRAKETAIRTVASAESAKAAVGKKRPDVGARAIASQNRKVVGTTRTSALLQGKAASGGSKITIRKQLNLSTAQENSAAQPNTTAPASPPSSTSTTSASTTTNNTPSTSATQSNTQMNATLPRSTVAAQSNTRTPPQSSSTTQATVKPDKSSDVSKTAKIPAPQSTATTVPADTTQTKTAINKTPSTAKATKIETKTPQNANTPKLKATAKAPPPSTASRPTPTRTTSTNAAPKTQPKITRAKTLPNTATESSTATKATQPTATTAPTKQQPTTSQAAATGPQKSSLQTTTPSAQAVSRQTQQENQQNVANKAEPREMSPSMRKNKSKEEPGGRGRGIGQLAKPAKYKSHKTVGQANGRSPKNKEKINPHASQAAQPQGNTTAGSDEGSEGSGPQKEGSGNVPSRIVQLLAQRLTGGSLGLEAPPPSATPRRGGHRRIRTAVGESGLPSAFKVSDLSRLSAFRRNRANLLTSNQTEEDREDSSPSA